MVEIEQTVIGSLIMNFKGCGDAANDVMPEWFADTRYKAIMARIKELQSQNITPDSITIIQNMTDETKAEVLKCANIVPSVSNFSNYAEQLKQSWRKRTIEARLQNIALEGVHDADETIEELRSLVSMQDDIAATSNKEVGTKFMDAAADFCSGLGNDSIRYLTGFPKFDDTVGGLLPGTVLVLAARSGQGKTDFAISLMMRFATAGLKLLYYSMEMNFKQLMTRISAQMTGINNTRIRDHELSNAEISDICRVFGLIKGNENIRLVEGKQSLATIRKDVKSFKPDIIFIDHLGLMKMPYAKSRYDAVAETTRALHELAGATGVSIVEVVQMNREVEKRKSKRPLLSDLKESGTIEEDADYVIFLQADKGDKPLTGNDAFQSHAFVEKNRHGGTGTSLFAWRPQYSRFSEVVGSYEYKGD